MPVARILVVDDEDGIRFSMRDFLEVHGYEVEEAESLSAAWEVFQRYPPDLALVDYRLPDGTALDLLARLKQADSAIPLIILTGHGSVELAVKAIQEGAEQFLTKPIELPALQTLVERSLLNARTLQKNKALTFREARLEINPFIGESSAIRDLARMAGKVLSSESPILITGETGTGKGVLARWLHEQGPRKDQAFVDLNCASLSKEFLETELFGHTKGAFTGAVAAKTGLLEVGHRGTVFLDEIGDMDLTVQPKLLKVLEEKSFRRLGEIRDRFVDIRLIAAAHQDLAHQVQEHNFRSDLYFRISTLPLHVPPLRRRTEDIPFLAETMVRNLCNDLGRQKVELSAEAEKALQAYHWPGNIRELRNVLERAILVGDREAITPQDLLFEALAPSPSPSTDPGLPLSEVERRHILSVLENAAGNVGAAAHTLGISRSSLYQKIKQYQIEKS